ncbi:MAG: AsmA family protein [Verrucomicrobiota bacterium]|nr:AsmA family protein [Verrucomicrobiota bacterium]
MKKFHRIGLILVVAIAGILATALLAVNLYVQSGGTQQRIQEELSQRLGTTLRIQRISVTPWFGLKLTGITMPQTDPAAGDFLQADTFRLRVRLQSLFAQRLVINEIALVHPQVVWAQNEDGRWRLPRTAVPEETAATTAPEAPGVQPPVTNSTPAKTVAIPPVISQATPPVDANRPFTPEVRRVTLTNGNFRFLDAHGKPVASFAGVGFRSSVRNSTELRGDAKIAKISLRDRFFLSDLRSPLQYEPAELDLSEISAHAAEGEITGKFSMRPLDADSPFTVMIAFHGVEADRVVSDAGGPSGMITGKIEGRLDAHGATADPNALAGTGEIYLRGGEVRQFSLLVALSQLLQIEELSQLRLEQARVKYHIAPGVVMIDELLLASPNLRISATGTVDFQGKLKLESQLAVNERIRGRLFAGMRESFRPIEEPGFAAVDFQVTGTVDRPKTNLMGKLVGRDLRDLGGVLNSLLGGGKSERSKKKKGSAGPVLETPAPPAPVNATIPAIPPEAAANPSALPSATPSP